MEREYKVKAVKMGNAYIVHLPKELYFWMENVWYEKGLQEKYPGEDFFFSFSYEGKNIYCNLGEEGVNVIKIQYIGRPGAMSYRITLPFWVYYKLGKNLVFKADSAQKRVLVMSDSCPE